MSRLPIDRLKRAKLRAEKRIRGVNRIIPTFAIESLRQDFIITVVVPLIAQANAIETEINHRNEKANRKTS